MTTPHKLPYAEDCNYWQTGQSSADNWIDEAKKEIMVVGGKILGDAYGNDATTGRSAYMIQFKLGDEPFKIVWPVLPTRRGSQRAAQIQAATMLYHDVKARCVSAKVLGAKTAFFSYFQLPDGRSASEATSEQLAEALPSMFRLQLTQRD